MRMKTWLSAAATVGLALSLAACGKGTAKVTADSNGLLPLKIGYTAPGAGYSDLYNGVDYGIFKKHGLKVTIVRLNDSSQLVPALASNSVQIGVGVGADSAAAILHGSDLRYIAMSEPHYNLEMWAAPNITTFADLKGKKVGLTSPGSQGDFGLTDLLESKGMKRSDVQSTFLKGVPAEVAALESGAVSAILTQPPQGTQTREKGAHRLAEMSGLPFPLGAYTVQASYLQKNREVLQKFYAAEAESLQYVRTHKKETSAVIQKYTGVKSQALSDYAYDFFLNVWQQTPAVDPKLIQQAFDEAAKNTHLKAPADVSKYIDNSLASGA
ncbi:MAG: NitT/TauT family transport system substrate-binding protein [Actinoallomurus sp.]|nr:NitT/TauT family transport system substrate-binding protein [Actinoallomurus sp.]